MAKRYCLKEGDRVAITATARKVSPQEMESIYTNI